MSASDSIQYKPKAAQPISVASVQGLGRGVINKAAWDRSYKEWCKRRGLREIESDFQYGRSLGRALKKKLESENGASEAGNTEGERGLE
jgi:hypothetical protein